MLRKRNLLPRQRRKAKENQNLLQRILLHYSLIVIFLGLILVVISSSYYLRSVKQLTKISINQSHERLLRITEDKERSVDNFTNHLYSNQEALDDIVSYFSDDYTNYINTKLERYYLSDSLSGIDFKSASKLFFSNDDSYHYSEIIQEEAAYTSERSDSNEPLLLVSNPLNFSKNERQIGTINVYYSFQDFEKVLAQADNISALALDPQGNLVWQSALITRSTAEKVLAAFQKNDDLSPSQINEESDFYFTSFRTNYAYTFVTIAPIPDQTIIFTPKPLLVMSMLVLTITFLIFLLRRLFKNYTEQINSILTGMTTAKKDPLSSSITVHDKHAELKVVSETFNHLIRLINTHVDQNYKLEIKQQEAELKALQSQINPHFLYNTLEFIRMSALKDGNEDLSEMVYILGQLFRNSITQQKETTLYEEVETSKLYMKLFQTKHPNKIAFQFSLAPDVEHIILPKFIIQPLIENYVLHGVDYKKNNNVIQLKAFKVKQQLTIQIIDNGKGIAPEQLKRMNNYLTTSEDALTSVGFKNVNERLRLFFGSNYQMRLTSEPHLETKIQLIITLPELELKEDHHV